MSSVTKKELPIGIFDSGVGGLTVLRALKQVLPHENLLYLGDTARLPYGTKSPHTVKNYALHAADVLVSKGIKMLVVACNTATAVAIDALQAKFAPIPVIGVVFPGAKAALVYPDTGPIVVLATESTAKWHAYRSALAQMDPSRQVIEWPCSLLVALAEEGWCHGELTEKIIHRILSPLLTSLGQQSPSCVLLGCTHFPILKPAIENVLGSIPVVDPAQSFAQEIALQLSEQNLLRPQSKTANTVQFMATDGVERFARVAQIFLGHPISTQTVELINVELNASVPLARKFA